jgi:hypothetical protein
MAVTHPTAVRDGIGTVTTPGGAGGFWFNYDQKI